MFMCDCLIEQLLCELTSIRYISDQPNYPAQVKCEVKFEREAHEDGYYSIILWKFSDECSEGIWFNFKRCGASGIRASFTWGSCRLQKTSQVLKTEYISFTGYFPHQVRGNANGYEIRSGLRAVIVFRFVSLRLLGSFQEYHNFMFDDFLC